MYGQKTAFLLIFWQIQMKLLQVEMEIYHLKMHFKVVRHQMSHCYLPSKFKNNTRKWYFEYFIADYSQALNKKDPGVNISCNFFFFNASLQFWNFSFITSKMRNSLPELGMQCQNYLLNEVRIPPQFWKSHPHFTLPIKSEIYFQN